MDAFRECKPEDLLGSLNDVEQRHAPKAIYVAGDLGIMEAGARVSIVGSRKASDAALIRARRLSRLLVERGVVVVSGLAEGIDTAAHVAAIESGGKTIAVLGTPLDKVYPKSNSDLQNCIMREHLCISQFPSGYPVQPKSFPMRNRTMALFSDATVIVEAGNKSGSLHQGWEALRLGRGLFIAKSVAESPHLAWPQEMIHYGAQVLADETIDDFLAFLPARSAAEPDGAFPL
ncbi:MAG: DNA-protecting protein DprA [Planctomycetes bacterium]|nr:DNA-protecting protein DprA [Planctomycetota bacterium]